MSLGKNVDKIRVAVNGAAGQMGRRVIALVVEDDECKLECALEREGVEYLGRDVGELAGVGATGINITTKMCDSVDVMIDFSTPDACLDRLDECACAGAAAVVGTTGFKADEQRKLKGFGTSIPLLVAPNMSLGVNLMFRLVAQVATVLGESYDIEIVESHHKYKKDAPSGTAVKMAEVICKAMNWEQKDVLAYGREGIVGPRPSSQLGIHAIRGGDVVGEHTVIYAGEGERFELTHRASNKNVFAAGAINAAKFLKGRKAGLYGMEDMLNIS